MNLRGIDHVAIIVSNYEASKHFYMEVLGFKMVAETYREERDSYKLDLELKGGDRLELFSFPGAPARPNYPEACGLRHLSFQTADIDEAAAFLTGKGFSVEDIRLDELTGRRFTFFFDPDGLPLELYERA